MYTVTKEHMKQPEALRLAEFIEADMTIDGDAPRKNQDQKAYENGWDRIFGQKKKDQEEKKTEEK